MLIRSIAPILSLLLTLPAIAAETDALESVARQIADRIEAKPKEFTKLFTPELIYGHASGAIETKQKYLDRLKSGKQRYDSMEIESMRIVIEY